MRYRVEITKRAERQFDSLPREAQLRVNKLFDVLAADPRSHGAVKMQGHAHLYRMRTGDWRVVYEIRDKVLLVLVITVGHRRGIYRGRNYSGVRIQEPEVRMMKPATMFEDLVV